MNPSNCTPSSTATSTATRADDARARLLARTEFRRPLVVEAGAGTGKTATLVSRVLAWTLGPGWDAAVAAHSKGASAPGDALGTAVLGGVVAITFTEAASAEMAERVALGLRGVAGGEPPIGISLQDLPPDAPDRARLLLGCLDALEVRTIHSFCTRLLQEHALAAGLHPTLAVDADGDQTRALVEELVGEYLRQGYADPPDADLLALGEDGIGPHDIVNALLALVGACVPATDLQRDPLAPERVAPLASAVRSLLDTVADQLAPLAQVKRGSNLWDLQAALAEQLPGLSSSPDLATLQQLASTLLADHGGALAKLKKPPFRSKKENEALGQPPALFQAGAQLLPQLQFLADLDADGLRRVIRVLSPLLAQVQEQRRRRGLLGFSDLLERAAALLQDAPAVRRRIRRDIQQLLVDEFQDTDPLQCRVVGLIALDGPVEERPGLFLVGDPKQSIYGFRRADLAAYEGFVQQVLAEGGERIPLVVNFRSVPAVLTAVEGAIAPVMIEEPGHQPPFQPLLPCDRLADAPGFTSPTQAPVELWAPWAWQHGAPPVREDRQVKGPIRLLEAQALARDIVDLHARGVGWKDVAVLFRAGTDLPALVDALRDAGVPYAVERDRNFFRRREINDAVNLVSVVAAPHDQVALVGWLRSSMVGVPDAALLPLWRRGFPKAVADLRGPDADKLDALTAMIRAAAAELRVQSVQVPGLDRIAGWELAAVQAMDRLARLRRSLREDATDRFVRKLRDLSLVELSEAARYLGAWRLANLDRFFRGLQEGLGEGGDLQVVLRNLREGLAGTRESEEGRPQEAAEDAVQLMTVHKSKGLGFEHVYVVGLDKGGRGPTDRGSVVHDADAWRLLGHDSLALPGWTSRQQAREQVEKVRLLYVAMTRAKQRLVLAGRWPDAPEPQPDAATAGSLVDLLGGWSAVPEDLAAQAEALPDDVDRLDVDGARFVFPGRLPLPPLPQAATRAQPTVPLASPAQVRKEARTLVSLQDQARRRQGRPWTRAVSAEAHARLEEDAATDATPAFPAVQPDAAQPGRMPPPPPGVTPEQLQEAAMAAGSAVHRALELLDLGAADPAEALARQVQRLPEHVAAFVDPDSDAVIAGLALDRARIILGGLEAGQLLARLQAAADHVVARELPLLLPPGPDDAGGPVAGMVGAVDLLLWDPDQDQLVVVDYKTDDVSGDALDQRARVYTSQARAYLDAVTDALAPARPPRAELWFLQADAVVRVAG